MHPKQSRCQRCGKLADKILSFSHKFEGKVIGDICAYCWAKIEAEFEKRFDDELQQWRDEE